MAAVGREGVNAADALGERDAPRGPGVVSWSGGKDSALALREVRRAGLAVAGLLTTVTEGYERVSMHGVRRELLQLQADAAGLPLTEVRIPPACPHEVYEQRMGSAVRRLVAGGARWFAFGDLFLSAVRAYRERQLAPSGAEPVFPLWGRDTSALGREFIDLGFRAVLCTVDPRRLARSFAGRDYDLPLLRDLPPDVDPCGENGEFHSFVWDGPILARPVAIARGVVVERDGFVFADLVPCGAAGSDAAPPPSPRPPSRG